MATHDSIMRLSTATSKSEIRQGVWDFMEASNIAVFPRPVHHRIPNFKGASVACNRACKLPAFEKAKIVKVGPDKPLEICRDLVMKQGKSLVVPTPRLRNGLFNRILPPSRDEKTLRECSTSRGVREFSEPISLTEALVVDAVVTGSVAVSRTGDRIGKGEGFSDLELAMMQTTGALKEETSVVTVVHDCQVIDFDGRLCGEHDFPVDIIVTPTEVIFCGKDRKPRPRGIIWSLLSLEKVESIPVLSSIRSLCQHKLDEKEDLPRKDPHSLAAKHDERLTQPLTVQPSARHPSSSSSSSKSKKSAYRLPHLR